MSKNWINWRSMEKKKANNAAIPFGKAVRVGNYKLWRSRYKTGDMELGVLHISTLDGAWMTRIPSTLEMYGWLCVAYGDYMSDDVERRFQGEAVLTTTISNMLYSSSIVNGYYHRALELCATVYAHPTLLDKKSKEHKDFMKDVKDLADKFLEWRKGYDEHIQQNEPTEASEHQEDIAEQAVAILSDSDVES